MSTRWRLQELDRDGYVIGEGFGNDLVTAHASLEARGCRRIKPPSPSSLQHTSTSGLIKRPQNLGHPEITVKKRWWDPTWWLSR